MEAEISDFSAQMSQETPTTSIPEGKLQSSFQLDIFPPLSSSISSEDSRKRPNCPLSSGIQKRYKIEVSNKFEPLTRLPSNNTTDTPINENQSQNSLKSNNKSHHDKKSNRIPPIFLYEANNYMEVIKDLRSMKLTSDFEARQFHEKIKIQLQNSDDFRTVTKYYEEMKLKFHSFVNPISTKLSVIMRPIPYSLTDEEIKQDLISLLFPVASATRLFNRLRQPTPLVSIILENNKDEKNPQFRSI